MIRVSLLDFLLWEGEYSMVDYSSIIVRESPLVSFTSSKTSPLIWTGGATLTVVGEHLLVTDHAAAVLNLRGQLPANTWAIVRILQITSAFAGTEIINVGSQDSNGYNCGKVLNKSVTATNMFFEQDMQSDHSVLMYIPVNGFIRLFTDGALTLNDDLTTAIWGQLYQS